MMQNNDSVVKDTDATTLWELEDFKFEELQYEGKVETVESH